MNGIVHPTRAEPPYRATPAAGVAAQFARVFARAPAATGAAPGRVNLLGEHTDYNDGLVLPAAIPRVTRVAVAPAPDGIERWSSPALGQRVELEAGAPLPPGFARYIGGCLAVLRDDGHAVPPLLLHVDSDVPVGVGLSSSAALEVAVLRAVRALLDLPIDDLALALLAQRAEVEYAGVRCGLLDQLACTFCDVHRMAYVDLRSFERSSVALPEGAALLVVDSGADRRLAESGYNQRRSECESAAAWLGVRSLRDLPEEAALDGLPGPLGRRVRHVLAENARVRRARTADATELGRLMDESHASLRDDYEVSSTELDCLARQLQAHPAVLGAKLTGAGFGGACVALVGDADPAAVGAEVVAACAARLPRARVLVADRCAAVAAREAARPG